MGKRKEWKGWGKELLDWTERVENGTDLGPISLSS